MAVFTGLGLGDERWVVGIVVEMSRKGDQSGSAVGTHSLQTKKFVPLASHFPLGSRTGVSQLLSLCSMYLYSTGSSFRGSWHFCFSSLDAA